MTLAVALEDLLDAASNQMDLSSTSVFADFLWDDDMPVAEVFTLEPAVVVDAKATLRRIVLQAIRGEVRYWLTTNRDPQTSCYPDTELGVLGSPEDACMLCREFLTTDTLTPRLRAARRRLDRPEVALESELLEVAPRLADRYAFQTCRGTAALAWDVRGASPAASGGAVKIDSLESARRVVLQREAGEIRYWLSADRSAPSDEHDELGSVASIAAALELCDEFLGRAVDAPNLVTRRRARPSGR